MTNYIVFKSYCEQCKIDDNTDRLYNHCINRDHSMTTLINGYYKYILKFGLIDNFDNPINNDGYIYRYRGSFNIQRIEGKNIPAKFDKDKHIHTDRYGYKYSLFRSFD